MTKEGRPGYRENWERAIRHRENYRTNVPVFAADIQAIDALIVILESHYEDFLEFAQSPPDSTDPDFTLEIQEVYVSLEEFRRFLLFGVIDPLSDWDSTEWGPTLDLLEDIATSEAFRESWGLISALWADLERGTISNLNRLFTSLNWMRILCRDIKKASSLLKYTKREWERS